MGSDEAVPGPSVFPSRRGLTPRGPSEPRRGIDSPVVIRRGEWAQMKLCRDLGVPSRVQIWASPVA